jgi:gamma-glutamylcyclotransferase (GGCT)/AIG2-like uncharacterized protein YtfP
MYYFAYGSNMSARIMGEWCSEFRFLGVARLEGYRLAFNKPSQTWGGAAADVIAAAGQTVWGVLWEVDEACGIALDDKESLGEAYDYLECSVMLADGRVYRARSYTVIHKRDPELRPSQAYKEVILEGAVEHGLPPDYIAWLRSLPVAT